MTTKSCLSGCLAPLLVCAALFGLGLVPSIVSDGNPLWIPVVQATAFLGIAAAIWWPEIPGKRLITRIAPRHRLTAGFLAVGVLTFYGLTVWAYSKGETAFQQTFSDSDLDSPKPAQPHGRFELDSRQIVQWEVSSFDMENSWLWLKAVIVDEKDRPASDHTFNLEHYSGHDWAEISRHATRFFVLPAGTYRILLYAEDPEESTRWVTPGPEEVQVELRKGIVLARYFVIGGVLCFLSLLFFLAVAHYKKDEYVKKQLLLLEVDDRVGWNGSEYTVDGKIRYDEEGWEWFDFALWGDGDVLWLTVDAESLDVTLWRQTHDFELTDAPFPDEIEFDGETYTKVESGEASVEHTGRNRGGKQGLRMKYHDYEGPGDRRLSVEEWPAETEAFAGNSISPYAVDLEAGSGA